MALTIVATPGAPTANSFVTEADAITYMAARLNASAWSTVTGTACTEDEKKALVEATREITARDYVGVRSLIGQALAWPRAYATNPDAATAAAGWYDVDVIPARVKEATCELAFQFLNLGTTDVAALPSDAGVIEKTIDVITTRYEPRARPTGMARFPRVLNLLRPLFDATASGGITLVRG